MKYPVIVRVYERHTDPWYYYCENEDQLKKASLDAFQSLEGRLYVEEPSKDRYPEVSDEYIEKAPTESIKHRLLKIKKNRKQWLSESTWHNSYRQVLHFYKLYESAKNGHGGSAYHYLQDTGYLTTHTPTEIE